MRPPKCTSGMPSCGLGRRPPRRSSAACSGPHGGARVPRTERSLLQVFCRLRELQAMEAKLLAPTADAAKFLHTTSPRSSRRLILAASGARVRGGGTCIPLCHRSLPMGTSTRLSKVAATSIWQQQTQDFTCAMTMISLSIEFFRVQCIVICLKLLSMHRTTRVKNKYCRHESGT